MISSLRTLALLLPLMTAALGAACNGGVDTGTGGHAGTTQGTGGGSDAGSDGDSGADGADTGADSGVCPDWFGNMPGAACTVPQGTECGGNSGVSFVFLRCCNGHWLAPDGGSSESPPCP